MTNPRQQHCLVRALQLSGEASPSAWANLGILYAHMGESARVGRLGGC